MVAVVMLVVLILVASLLRGAFLRLLLTLCGVVTTPAASLLPVVGP